MKKLMIFLIVISLCSCGVYRSHPRYSPMDAVYVKKHKDPKKIPRKKCHAGYKYSFYNRAK